MKRSLLQFMTILIILLVQMVSFGQAPDLGTASSFAVFTSTGAFTNVSASTHITGDIGTNVGIFTGFPPGVVLGNIQVANALTAQVADDLAGAYTSLSSVSCGTVLTTTLGNGQLFTPGTYCHGAATTLAGTLTLDGGGNPNALFIIKIGGAFATSTFSNVVLINSASACNVYWQINGQFDLGDYSEFKGTLLVNGAINLLEGSNLEGRVLSIAGAIALSNNLVSFAPDSPEPIIGSTEVCQGQTSVIYSVPAINNASGYVWALPLGASITFGENTNNITVNFSANASSGDIVVYGVNACGNGPESSEFILVWPVSSTSLIYHQ